MNLHADHGHGDYCRKILCLQNMPLVYLLCKTKYNDTAAIVTSRERETARRPSKSPTRALQVFMRFIPFDPLWSINIIIPLPAFTGAGEKGLHERLN